MPDARNFLSHRSVTYAASLLAILGVLIAGLLRVVDFFAQPFVLLRINIVVGALYILLSIAVGVVIACSAWRRHPSEQRRLRSRENYMFTILIFGGVVPAFTNFSGMSASADNYLTSHVAALQLEQKTHEREGPDGASSSIKFNYHASGVSHRFEAARAAGKAGLAEYARKAMERRSLYEWAYLLFLIGAVVTGICFSISALPAMVNNEL